MRDLFGREHEVHAAGPDSTPGHRVVLGGSLALREGNPLCRLDLAESQSAVGAAAREDHGDRVGPLVFGERAQEPVDRHEEAGRFHAWGEPQAPQLDCQIGVRGDDVDAITLDALFVNRLRNLHLGFASKDFSQHARVIRVEVLDEHNRHPRTGREAPHQHRKGLEPPGRCANAHDGKSARGPVWVRKIRRVCGLNHGSPSCAPAAISPELVLWVRCRITERRGAPSAARTIPHRTLAP